jgi:hypothetical protein
LIHQCSFPFRDAPFQWEGPGKPQRFQSGHRGLHRDEPSLNERGNNGFDAGPPECLLRQRYRGVSEYRHPYGYGKRFAWHFRFDCRIRPAWWPDLNRIGQRGCPYRCLPCRDVLGDWKFPMRRRQRRILCGKRMSDEPDCRFRRELRSVGMSLEPVPVSREQLLHGGKRDSNGMCQRLEPCGKYEQRGMCNYQGRTTVCGSGNLCLGSSQWGNERKRGRHWGRRMSFEYQRWFECQCRMRRGRFELCE